MECEYGMSVFTRIHVIIEKGDRFMELKSAQMFVMKMKQDQKFRQEVSGVSNREVLWDLIKKQGYAFDEKELVCAMASCMTEPEQGGE